MLHELVKMLRQTVRITSISALKAQHQSLLHWIQHSNLRRFLLQKPNIRIRRHQSELLRIQHLNLRRHGAQRAITPRRLVEASRPNSGGFLLTVTIIRLDSIVNTSPPTCARCPVPMQRRASSGWSMRFRYEKRLSRVRPGAICLVRWTGCRQCKAGPRWGCRWLRQRGNQASVTPAPPRSETRRSIRTFHARTCPIGIFVYFRFRRTCAVEGKECSWIGVMILIHTADWTDRSNDTHSYSWVNG